MISSVAGTHHLQFWHWPLHKLELAGVQWLMPDSGHVAVDSVRSLLPTASHVAIAYVYVNPAVRRAFSPLKIGGPSSH